MRIHTFLSPVGGRGRVMRRVAGRAVPGAAVLLLAACAIGTPPADPAAAQRDTARPSSASPDPSSPCTTGQLGLDTNGIDGGLDHAGFLLTFVNHGTSCTISGYPTVTAIPANQTPSYPVQHTPNGYLGGLPTETHPMVRLATGETASALIEATGAGCPAEGIENGGIQLVVIPPHNTQAISSTDLEAPYPCNIQVHAVVPTGPLLPLPAQPTPQNPDTPNHIVDAFENYTRSHGG